MAKQVKKQWTKDEIDAFTKDKFDAMTNEERNASFYMFGSSKKPASGYEDGVIEFHEKSGVAFHLYAPLSQEEMDAKVKEVSVRRKQKEEEIKEEPEGMILPEELAKSDASVPATIKVSKEVAKQEDLITTTILQINRIMEGAYKNAMLDIGRLVVKRFFKERKKPNIYKGPLKTKSYRKLVEHEQLPISKSNLWNCVQVALQEGFLNAQEEVDVSHLSFSHLLALLKVKKRADKITWIRKLKANPLSVSQFEKVLEKSSSIEDTQKAIGFFKSLGKIYAEIPSFDFAHMDREDLLKQAKIKDQAEFDKQVDAWLKTLQKATADLLAIKNVIDITEFTDVKPPLQIEEAPPTEEKKTTQRSPKNVQTSGQKD